MTTLEHRYRRLLALYPAAHRRYYGEEMLAVLMDGATERQRSPRPAEAWNLFWNAIVLRLTTRGPRAQRDPQWTVLVSAFVPLAALVMAARPTAYVVQQAAWPPRTTEGVLPSAWPWPTFAYAAIWLIVAATAAAGLRVVPALMAWLAFAVTVIRMLDPGAIPTFGPFAVLSLGIAIGLSLPARDRRPVGGLIGGRLTLLAVVTFAAYVTLPWLTALATLVTVNPDGSYTFHYWADGLGLIAMGVNGPVGLIPLTVQLLAIVLAIRILIKVGGSIRHKLAAFLVLELTVLLLVWPLAADLPTGNWLWLAIASAPIPVFAVALLLTRRADDRPTPIPAE